MILAPLLALLAGAPKLELGGVAGMGRVFGGGDVAQGRSEDAVEPIQAPWTAGGWIAYQWKRGHDLGVRVQAWHAEGDAVGMGDYGGGSETLDILAYGLEYTRLRPLGSSGTLLRIGGGGGFAQATDELSFHDGQPVSASGDGAAGWLRGGVSTPIGPMAVHLAVAGMYAGFPRMKSKQMESFETSYWILQGEIGFSFGS